MTNPVNEAVATKMKTGAEAEQAVRERYTTGAQAVEASLCCPTQYDGRWLGAIPKDVLERDYGCGDPSKHLKEGEIVLDLGSGSGKICFIASQVVGKKGRVIGVDMNDEMLNLARSHRAEVANNIGYSNVSFHKARIQDLALDLDSLEDHLQAQPIDSVNALERFEQESERRRTHEPLVADGAVDVVVSNCVLNLVRSDAKRQLFAELFRVIRPGGRAVISDIVSDKNVSPAMQADPELWSGCISGALREDEFLEAFELAGFEQVGLAARSDKPWRTVQGIEFRSVTVIAYKQPTEATEPVAPCAPSCC